MLFINGYVNVFQDKVASIPSLWLFTFEMKHCLMTCDGFYKEVLVTASHAQIKSGDVPVCAMVCH